MWATILDEANLRYGNVGEGNGKYKHFLGGPAFHQGVMMPAVERPAHLLYCFDLDDPQLGIRIPGVRWLPIYFAFHQMGKLCYRVLSDERVEILGKPFRAEADQSLLAFYKDFPGHFRKRSTEVRMRDYDPTNIEELATFGTVFGAGRLSDAEKLRIKREVEEKHSELICGPDGQVYPTLEDLIPDLAGDLLFGHGFPEGYCPNQSCPNRNRADQMMFWFIVVPGERDGMLYKALAGDDLGQLRVLICPLCHSISVSNVCT